MPDVRPGQSEGLLWSALGGGDPLLCGEWGERGVGKERNNCGWELPGSRINFDRRDPLAGFTTPECA